jgi:hypothetical protein
MKLDAINVQRISDLPTSVADKSVDTAGINKAEKAVETTFLNKLISATTKPLVGEGAETTIVLDQGVVDKTPPADFQADISPADSMVPKTADTPDSKIKDVGLALDLPADLPVDLAPELPTDPALTTMAAAFVNPPPIATQPSGSFDSLQTSLPTRVVSNTAAKSTFPKQTINQPGLDESANTIFTGKAKGQGSIPNKTRSAVATFFKGVAAKFVGSSNAKAAPYNNVNISPQNVGSAQTEYAFDDAAITENSTNPDSSEVVDQPHNGGTGELKPQPLVTKNVVAEPAKTQSTDSAQLDDSSVSNDVDESNGAEDANNNANAKFNKRRYSQTNVRKPVQNLRTAFVPVEDATKAPKSQVVDAYQSSPSPDEAAPTELTPADPTSEEVESPSIVAFDSPASDDDSLEDLDPGAKPVDPSSLNSAELKASLAEQNNENELAFNDGIAKSIFTDDTFDQRQIAISNLNARQNITSASNNSSESVNGKGGKGSSQNGSDDNRPSKDAATSESITNTKKIKAFQPPLFNRRLETNGVDDGLILFMSYLSHDPWLTSSPAPLIPPIIAVATVKPDTLALEDTLQSGSQSGDTDSLEFQFDPSWRLNLAALHPLYQRSIAVRRKRAHRQHWPVTRRRWHQNPIQSDPRPTGLVERAAFWVIADVVVTKASHLSSLQTASAEFLQSRLFLHKERPTYIKPIKTSSHFSDQQSKFHLH